MSEPQELFAYVERADSAYRWEKQGERAELTGKVIRLHLVSQVWQSIPWNHTLELFIPNTARNGDTAVLYITGFSSRELQTEMGHLLAHAMQSVVAFLYDIPNQPLFDDLYEDALIAHTFTQYLDSGDASWPLLFPMVKGAQRAIDATQAALKEAGQPVPQRFFVTGASKRGWTSWLTAVTDKRVAAILPMVYDNLNIPAQMQHQVEAWGGFSEQIADYTEQDLQAKMTEGRGTALAQMIDPYSYLDRLTLPKLIINGSNDRYWAQDALNLYWEALPGPKWALYVPNAGHGLSDFERVVNTSSAFVGALGAREAFPQLSWQFTPTSGGVRLYLTSDTPAVAARLWTTHAPTQDFRDSVWTETPMRADNHREFEADIPASQGEWQAAFGEIEFEREGRPFTLSTQVHISKKS